jgi:gamma-glutamyl:cysteine ligase YbdK (ATP-grasp superfamily)
VKLGTYKNISELKKALMDSGFKLISDDRTNLLLDEMDFSEVATIIEADLILVSLKELGFKKGATSEEVLERARELGLELCPAEAAPQLQIQFPNQVENPYMYVRSKSGDLSCFHSTNSMIFAALPTSLQSFWSASEYFVFVRLRK